MRGSGERRAILLFGFLFLFGFCGAATGTLAAQSPIASRVRADNDAFNFWLPPWNRPDEEYTSGVQASLEYQGNAWWHRWFGPAGGACVREAKRCATRTYTLGQKIFSGARHIGDAGPAPGSRPSAGWLYVSEAERIATSTRLDETSLTIGVTGPPALAPVFQRIFHGYGAAYNRPTDWSRQLPFEPGVVVRYERTQRVLSRDAGGRWGVALEPHVGGALGTVLTEGVAGLRARASFPPRDPWQNAPVSSGPEFALVADAGLHGVARNEFLDGTLFRASDHVRSRPWVSEFQAGFTFRWRQFGASFEAHRIGSEYVTRPGSHSWSSISAEWRFRQ